MDTLEKEASFPKCQTEYGTLRRVLICQPIHMSIEEVINDVQKEYAEENINVPLAMKQHEQFEHMLKKHNVEVINLPTFESFPEQVFTRDIGFTVGEDIYVAEMANEIRKGEEKALENWLCDEGISFQRANERVEGGDVIIDGNTLYVGISGRTSEDAIRALEKDLPRYDVFRVPFYEKYLHLDCVFNILSPEVGLIFPKALEPEMVHKLKCNYNLIEVSEEEQFTMGTNVLSIGNNKVFSLPQNKNVNTQMREHGFEVIEVDFSEIIKSGGSFRCCTMPIERQ